MKPSKQFIISCIGILTIGAIVISSCKKTNSNQTHSFTENATIIDSGSLAADGCDWLIKTDITDSVYNVPNLPAQYHVNNLKVHITYHKLATRFYCGMIPLPQNKGITEIQLDIIEKK